jgi:hypothetical protein
MHALFVEVDSNVDDLEAARKALNEAAVPMARSAGARAGYWLAPFGGRGVAVVLFDAADQAQAMAANIQPGQRPPGAPEGVTFRTVEVREVIAQH